MTIRTLIVDDEPVARRGIRNQLKDESDIEIIGEACNGREAVAAINEKRPDLVFLDVQMPLLDGFGVIESLGKEKLPPAIVFVTAYDEHAIHAFEINALDYLLKPVDPERFQQSLARARKHLKTTHADEQLFALLDHLKSLQREKPEYLNRLTIKEAGRIFFVDASEVDWISSQGNYVQLHVRNKTHLMRETMDGLEQKLDPAEFVRIRRSTMVRTQRIKEFHALFNGEYAVILKDGTEMQSSRRYRQRLNQLFKR